MQKFGEIIKDVKEDNFITLQGDLLGLATGFKKLDKITKGFQNGQLILFGGRPGMGKTLFSLNIAKNIATDLSKNVVIFSMDSSAKKITNDILQLEQKRARFDSEISINDKLIKAPIYIDDERDNSIFGLMERAIIIKQSKNIDFMIIDYLQLMTNSDNGIDGKQKSFESIVRLLKILALSLNIPILLLSQIPRNVEERDNKWIMLSDINAYGSIEKYLDIVLFLYNWEYYGIDEDEDGKDVRNKARITIAKNRDGLLCDAVLNYNPSKGGFENDENSY